MIPQELKEMNARAKVFFWNYRSSSHWDLQKCSQKPTHCNAECNWKGVGRDAMTECGSPETANLRRLITAIKLKSSPVDCSKWFKSNRDEAVWWGKACIFCMFTSSNQFSCAPRCNRRQLGHMTRHMCGRLSRSKRRIWPSTVEHALIHAGVTELRIGGAVTPSPVMQISRFLEANENNES